MSAIIQRPRRITSESATDETKQAVDVVGSSFNVFADETYTAIMGNIGVTSNLNMEFKTLTLIVDSNGIPTETVRYQSSLNGKTIGISVIRALLAVPTNHPFVTYVDNSGLVTISHVSGLTAGTKYQLVILAIGT